MSQSPEEALPKCVYRRVCPPDYKIARNTVDSRAFKIHPWMKGLSVYHSDIATPYDALEARLEEARTQLQSEDAAKMERARKFLANNPDVKALVEKSQYRIVEIPIAALSQMGLTNLEQQDAKGHLNILGGVEEFDARAEDFIDLIETGQARILTAEECLQKR